MATTDNQFHHSTTEQDFAATGEIDIRKLVEAAPGTNSTTITTHANAAGTTQITLDPYTTRNTVGDIRANAGWAINRLGADGMDSTATTKRRILGGAWVFTMNVALPVAGTTTGTLTVSFIAAVYRVSSTGDRTLLFTATSNTGQSTGLSALASTTLTATSAAQPIITLEANETIHVGYISNLVQVAGLAGATVTGTATWTVGTASQSVTVPSPGVRSQTLSSLPLTATGTPATPVKAISKIVPLITSTVSAVFTRRITAFRSFVNTATGTLAFNRAVTAARSFAITGTGTTTLTRRVGKPLSQTATATAMLVKRVGKSLTYNVTVSPVFTKALSKGAFLVTATVTPTFARAVTAARRFTATATGTSKTLLNLSTDILERLRGGGGTIINVIKKITVLFDD